MTDRLAEMYRLMRRKEDSLHSDRVRDLLRKSRDREFVIAFCGHFSAGKSTLLNGLYGKNLLPTSPIPTSANVVKVRAGENRVVLTLHSGERRLFRGDYSDDDLKRLCKRGDEVIALDIYRKDAPLPKGVALLDTPGVDSTDDAHQAATESALHLADLIFYVMDYNHVQSEVNLRFIKELSARGKRIWLVINQVDKHREEELPFDRYRERVEETFGNWGLKPEGILYTSLKQPGHSLNQLPVLREKLREMIGERGNLAEESIRREAAHLVREHLSDLKERNRANIRERKDRLGGELPSLEELDRKLGLNREERERLVRERDGMEVEFLEGLEEILANAYLMPYENRELAHLYLETVLSRFRVGWFFSGGKTAKEKERRFRTFYEKLKQTVDTQLDVHVKQYLIRYLKEKGLYSEERGEAVYELASPLDPDWLRETVREGAGLTGDYLLKYTGDLADRIKGGHGGRQRNISIRWPPRFWNGLRPTWPGRRRKRADCGCCGRPPGTSGKYCRRSNSMQRVCDRSWKASGNRKWMEWRWRPSWGRKHRSPLRITCSKLRTPAGLLLWNRRRRSPAPFSLPGITRRRRFVTSGRRRRGWQMCGRWLRSDGSWRKSGSGWRTGASQWPCLEPSVRENPLLPMP